MDQDLWPLWFAAIDDGETGVDAAIARLYEQLDAAIAAKGPTCWQSGKCCHFDAYGHRLYVTGLEIARFVRLAPERASAKQGALPVLGQGDAACPWQVDNACTAHGVRPMGCRIFFCQRGTEAWQQDLYEQYLRQLRELHAEHGLEYRYMEWLGGLAEAEAWTCAPGR